MIEIAATLRTDDRAIQNNRAFYKLLINSITGYVRKILFETADSADKPIKDDGLDLFIKMIKTTTLASIQTSIKATNKLTTYCPSKAKYIIPQVNIDINHYIILATTSTRKFEDIEQISITMAVYDKIKQPQEWVAWLQQKKIEFNKGQITKCASFQSEAVSKTWFDYLQKGLIQRGWHQSEIDTCLFTKDGIVLVVYVDDAILISPYKGMIDREIKSLQKAYDLTDDGELKDYLGTRFVRKKDGTIELTQPKMIERVLNIVGLDPNNEQTKMNDTPADSNKILDDDPEGKLRKQQWNYRSAVGCLSYLQAMIRPDITFATQQCARFCNNPQRQHEEAVKRICRYLLKTKNRGLILKPDKRRGLECYCDEDWAGSWVERSSHDPLSSHSRTGFVIMYGGCPIVWSSKRQQLLALSTTEAEYIALSTALREVIGTIHLLEELRLRGFRIHPQTPKVTCRTFEDNKSCIEIATNHKTRARTKHLSVLLHHFRHHVINKTITIEHVSTTQQLGDIYTKPLAKPQFEYLRNKIMSWSSSPTRE